MQPARTKTATASRATAQSVVIMIGSFRSGGTRAGDGLPIEPFGGSASPNFDGSIMAASTYTAVARILRFCRLSAGLGEKDVGVEILP